MSFSAAFAGEKDRVRGQIEVPNNPFIGGDKLGQLTRDYLAAVAELVPDECSIIIESSGHADHYGTSVQVRLLAFRPPATT